MKYKRGLIVLLLLLWIGPFSFGHLRDAEGEIVYLTETTPPIVEREAETDLPESLHFRLNGKDKNLILRLRRNNMDNENADVYVIWTTEDGKESVVKECLEPDPSFGLYQDRESGGSFTVRCNSAPSVRCKRSLWGTLYVNGLPHTLTPDDVTARDTDDVTVTRYILKKTPVSSHRRSRPVRVPGIPVGQQMTSSQWNIFTSPEGVTSYGVELLAVVDYKIFKDFDEKSQQQQQHLNAVPYGNYNQYVNRGSKENTLKEIRQYFAHVVNGMDLRFGNVDAEDFSMYVKLAALIIADTPEKSKWTVDRARSGKQYGSKREIIDAKPTLKDFKTWVEKTDGLPTVDHAMLFTGYDLFADGSTGTLGIAYMNGLCGTWMTSLVESHGDMMATIETSTHELGHNLGATHDGSGNKCRSDYQFIMAEYAGTRHDAIQLNPWKWSTCSVEDFRKFLDKLENRKDNCLANDAKHGNALEFYHHTSRLPGQIYSLTEQCQLVEGDASYPCYNKFFSYEVCQKLSCSTPSGSCRKHLASRGTSCGNRQWCMDGRCQYDQRAPNMYF